MIGEILTFPVHADQDGAPVALVPVLASEHYVESDYIRDYGEFLRSIGK